MARQILPVFVTSGDVDDLKRRLRAASMGTDQSVQGCTSISDSQRAAWGLFYASVLEYTKQSSSFWNSASEMNRGQAYEDELVEWNKQIAAGGCQLVTPQYDPSKDANRDATVNAIKWASIAVGACAGAYIIGKVIEIIPRAPVKTEIDVKSVKASERRRLRR